MQMTGVWPADQYYKEQKSCSSLVGVCGNDLTGPPSVEPAATCTLRRFQPVVNGEATAMDLTLPT